MTVIARSKLTKRDLLAERPDVLIVTIDSVDRDVGELAEQLQAVLDLKPRKRPKVVVVTFSGYDEDHRELEEIPEVRAWCRRFLEGVTSSTVLALTDERRPLHHPTHQEIVRSSIGLLKFIVLAGYGFRHGDNGVGLTPEGSLVLACLTGEGVEGTS